MFLQSILVYSSLIIIMILFSLSASSRNSYYYDKDGLMRYKSFWRFDTIAPLFLFAIVFGMRYDVGVDHLSYLYGYLNKIYVGKDEYLFFLFSELGWYFNLHYAVYFGILAFIQVFFFFYAFKDERYLYPFLIFFLFANGEILSWMNIIRVGIAMVIWIFSLRFIHERKVISYVLWCIVALSFHKSAIILIVFYPIFRNGKDYIKSIPLQLLLLISSFIINASFGSLFYRLEGLVSFYTSVLGEENYKSYDIAGLSESFIESTGTNLAFYFKILVNIIVILYSYKLKKFYNSNRFIIMYSLFFLGLITTYIFPIGYISLTRPFRYFYIFQSIMYAYLAYYLYVNRRVQNNLLLLLFLTITFIGVFVLSQYTATENSHSLYQFFFEYNIWGYPN